MDGGEDRQTVPLLELRGLKVIAALGRGAKGVVFLAQSEATGDQLFALKVICKANIEKKRNDKSCDGNDFRRICFEQEVLRRFQHPLLPRLRGVLATDKIVGYAIDYCPGRDLHSLRKKQTEKMFSDDIIRFYAAELVLVLEHLHKLGIVYRDLKPENIMIQENGHLMLVDFDLSVELSPRSPAKIQTTPTVEEKSEPPTMTKKRLFAFNGFCNSGLLPEDSVSLPDPSVTSASSESESESESGSESGTESESVVTKSNSFVGTEEYVAPEIVSALGHDFAVDWWCFGVVLYEMLYGVTPFRGINRKETFRRILTKSPELVGEPTALRDLIGKLLVKDPKQRISVEAIKGHDFFRGVDWDMILRISRPPFIPTRSDDDEDMEGNNDIDVESFVHGIFQIGNDEKCAEGSERSMEIKKNQQEHGNNGVWVDGLNHPSETDKFVIF